MRLKGDYVSMQAKVNPKFRKFGLQANAADCNILQHERLVT